MLKKVQKHLIAAARRLLGVSAFLCFSSKLMAEQASALGGSLNSGDTALIIMASALVMLMTPGLAFFYAGMVRSKNTSSTIFQSFICLGLISVLWFVCGYSLSFGNDQGGFIGDLSMAFLKGVGNDPQAGSTIPHSLFMIFQCMFAIITPALITGAFAERIKFKSYLVFITFWSILIYTPVCHWVWGGGFMSEWGKLDFAGGTVVHITAGFSAFIAALVVGKRTDHGKTDFTPHNIPHICLGTALLWFGWFGFNAGSALAANQSAAHAFVTTHMAAAAAVLGWMVLDWLSKDGKPNLVGACIGAVVGLIAITPGAGYVSFGAALVIGFVASIISNILARIIKKSNIDDALDVFACHGMAGFVGVLLTGIFAMETGGLGQFLIQLKASVIAICYTIMITYILLKVIDLVIGLRPNAEEEVLGLDQVEHDEQAYEVQ